MNPTAEKLRQRILALGSPPLAKIHGAPKARADDLYECFVAQAVVAAASKRARVIELHDSGCRPTKVVRFRRAPGRLSTSPTSPFTHYCIDFGPGQTLQLHQGIAISGRSGTQHESDVALIKPYANRKALGWPRHPLGIEAKFYSDAVSLPVARSVVGLGSEMGFKRVALATISGLTANASSLLASRAFAFTADTFVPFHEAPLIAGAESVIDDYLAGNR